MVHVKTAISLDESLFREAEEWAGSWGLSQPVLCEGVRPVAGTEGVSR